MKITNLMLLAALSFSMSGYCATNKTDPKAEQRKAEERIMQEEDAAEQGLPMDKRPNGVFSGTLALYDAPAGDVLGTFVTREGPHFLVKTTRNDIILDLKKFNQKSITLVGKVRVKGKYLLVEAVNIPQPGPTRERRGKRTGS